MNHATIFYQEPQSKVDGPVIYISDMSMNQALKGLLSDSEHQIMEQLLAQELKYCNFPRTQGMAWVRPLKQDKDGAIALEEARLAGAEMLTQLRHYKISELHVVASDCTPALALAFVEGLALAGYVFGKYHTEPEKREKPLQKIHFSGENISAADIAELNAIVETVCLARDLVNEPFSGLNALQLAEVAQEAGKKYGFEVEVFGKEKIESLKMGGILAVNKASQIPPQFCIMEWKPAHMDASRNPIVLVGKGVVYDTGGLSIKSAEGMEFMKCDMAGAAAVLATLSLAAKQQLPVHLIGLIPITDNQVSEHAIVPGDVIRMFSGKTVEVANTDAEGRLILADALHYAKKYKPELVIDLATLTGAAIRALGIQAICYMGTAAESTKKAIESSGFQTYERLVEVPLWREYGEDLKSHVADIRNIGPASAGMITAGKFLEYFTDYPWLHLDFAGPAFLRKANGYRTQEGTGAGVRLLYHFLKNYPQQ